MQNASAISILAGSTVLLGVFVVFGVEGIYAWNFDEYDRYQTSGREDKIKSAFELALDE